ncbi:PilZ domain-containing protein [Sphingomonas sp. ASV193]|uniref:PilZ domain-containing protein n=1 Tax=Sphingomonas sp. ASV193 TaxID=3144405 RepID=UPI0032E863E0
MTDDSENQRQSGRVAMRCELEFRKHGGSRYPVDIFDISPEGARISPPVRVEAGQQVWLKVPGMDAIHGRIAWMRDWQAGVEFDNPFHPAVFQLIVERLRGPSAS